MQPETPSMWPKIAGIDCANASLLLDGDTDLFVTLLQIFIEENTGVVDIVKALIESDQAERACKILHKLRGQAGNIGAISLQEAAATLENALNSASSNVAEAVTAFEQIHSALCNAVKSWQANRTTLKPK